MKESELKHTILTPLPTSQWQVHPLPVTLNIFKELIELSYKVQIDKLYERE